MANGKDYYSILGVPKNASQEDIKQAYRKLAREHHPDMVKDGDKTAAETRFKEINEAYQILSDPQKRRMYDQFGTAGPQYAGGPGGFEQGFGTGQWGPFTYTTTGNAGFGDFDPFDVFEEFFGFRGFGNRAQRRGKNLAYEMQVTFAEAVHGTEKSIEVDSGPITIKIPQGARNGTELRFAGKGMPGPNGAPAGDLYITIRVSTPREFQVIGDNLGIALELNFTQVILGDIVEIPVVDLAQVNGLGKTNLKVPSGTQPGTQFRIRGKGMPRLNGRGQGDVIVQIYVKIPNKINKKQKELLEQYRNLS